MLEKTSNRTVYEWNQQMLQKPKLRTYYITFKFVFATEKYVMQTLSTATPYLISLDWESCSRDSRDRYTPVYDKHTKMNRKRHQLRDYVRHAIWDYMKMKSILICLLYLNIRQRLLNPILIDNPNFANLSNLDQMIYLMQFCQHDVMSQHGK